MSSLKPAPKMRPKASMRPRPKTIHIDSGSVQLAEGMSSKGKKGSTSNLTGKLLINLFGCFSIKVNSILSFFFCMDIFISFIFFKLANTFNSSSSMKRDYYRGSQDSLADRSMNNGLLYKGVFFFCFYFPLKISAVNILYLIYSCWSFVYMCLCGV